MARTRKRSRQLSNSGSTSNFVEVSPKKEVAQRSLRGRVVKVTAIPKKAKQKRGRKPSVRVPDVAKDRTYSLSPVRCNAKLETSLAILKTPVASSTCLIDETISFVDSIVNDENVDPVTENKEVAVVELEAPSPQKPVIKSFGDTMARMVSPVVCLTPLKFESLDKRPLRGGILKKPLSDLNDVGTPQNIAKRRKLNSKIENSIAVKQIKKTTFDLNNTPTNQNDAAFRPQIMKTPYAKDPVNKLKKTTFDQIKSPNTSRTESPKKIVFKKTPAKADNKMKKSIMFDLDSTTNNMQDSMKAPVVKTPFPKGQGVKLSTSNLNESLVVRKVGTPVKSVAAKTFTEVFGAPEELDEPSTKQPMDEELNLMTPQEQLDPDTTMTSKEYLQESKQADSPRKLKKDSTFEIKVSSNQNIPETLESKTGTKPKILNHKSNLIKGSGAPGHLRKDTFREVMKTKTEGASSKTPSLKTPLTKGHATPKQQDQKSECKSTQRTRMPNFAELHKKNFDRMESVFDHAQRKAERARELLSGRGLSSNNTNNTGDSNRVYNRFGFKSTKLTDIRRSIEIQEIKPQIPTIIARHEKHVQMSKKTVVKTEITSFKRRSILKGVRLNKRFDLQMKYRDCN